MTGEPVARLLIVDDEAAQAKALCQTLECEGYHTTGFTSAHQAVATLRTHSFDLMLTDLMMLEMDGITLVRTALEIDPYLVAIVMTGHGTIDTAVEAMKVGALDYILKPFKLSVVLPVLSRALHVRHLRSENAELTRCVSERSSELEAANKELEAFSFSVSHDLRNPLNTVIGYSQLLTKSYSAQMDAQARRMLGQITESAGRMEQLIAALLRLSSLGRQSLSKQSVRTGALVREVLEQLMIDYAKPKIEIRVDDLQDCFADPSLLRQVFVNLLSNALKFTRNKENASVEVGYRPQEGEHLYFVRDNGAGFDTKHAARLFDAFERLRHADDFEGTGVGLSIVKRIISRHGGRIWAEAEVDRGATFYFTLPAISPPTSNTG
jgi:two-component system, sensor histidine kinase and response regulator